MAGDWIKMRVDLAEDPAVIAMACALELDEFGIAGRLHKLWSWADKHCSNGHAKGVTFVWIDRYLSHAGFAQSMADNGWLARTADGIEFPHFDRHNGKSAKTRAEAADRKRIERLVTTKSQSMSQEMSQETCDKSVTREEKRREEEPTTLSSGDDVKLCPVGSIVDLYHELMPNNPRVKVVNEARKSAIRQRWREAQGLSCKPFFEYKTKAAGLEAWRQFFGICSGSTFLTGAAPAQPGRPAFVADIDFIFSASGFAKILENKYHRDAP